MRRQQDTDSNSQRMDGSIQLLGSSRVLEKRFMIRASSSDTLQSSWRETAKSGDNELVKGIKTKYTFR